MLITIKCLTFLLSLNIVVGLRCYQCNSDNQLNCGDPFYAQSIPVEECDTLNTFASFLCYKVSHYVGGQYVTSRGCAPFDPEAFVPEVQRSMTGTYWKSLFTGNMISFCDYNTCNGSQMIKISTPSFIFTVLSSILYFYYYL